MPTGIGYAPAGYAPFGLGTPDSPPGPGGTIFRDGSNGRVLGARRIDPKARDYVFGADGRTQGMTAAQQAMVLAFCTEQYTSAVSALGNRLGQIKVINDGTVRQAETLARECAAPVVAAGLVEIVSVTVTQPKQNALLTLVRWRDLATGAEHTTEA